MSLTPNRNYPLVNGDPATNILTDLGNVKQALIDIDADVEALDQSAELPYTLLNSTSYNGPGISALAYAPGDYGLVAGDTMLITYADVELNNTLADMDAALLLGSVAGGYTNHTSRARQWGSVQYTAGSSLRWSIGGGGSIRTIRKLSVMLKLFANGGVGKWSSICSSYADYSVPRWATGIGTVGFAAGNTIPTGIMIWATNAIIKCGAKKLYKLSAKVADQLWV